MKGTICYVMCYIAQNKNLKTNIEESYDFFFNTDICFPKNMKELYMNSKTTYENKKLKEICMHTREFEREISEIEILYMLGFV